MNKFNLKNSFKNSIFSIFTSTFLNITVILSPFFYRPSVYAVEFRENCIVKTKTVAGRQKSKIKEKAEIRVTLNPEKSDTSVSKVTKVGRKRRNHAKLLFGSEYTEYKYDPNLLSSAGSFDTSQNKSQIIERFSPTAPKIGKTLNNKQNLFPKESENIFIEYKNVQSFQLKKLNEIRSGGSFELFVGSLLLIISSFSQAEKLILENKQNINNSNNIFSKIKAFFKKKVDSSITNVKSYYKQLLALLGFCILVYFNQDYIKSTLICSWNFLSAYLNVNGIISTKTIQKSRWLERDVETNLTEEKILNKIDEVSNKDSELLENKPGNQIEEISLIDIVKEINLDDSATNAEKGEIENLLTPTKSADQDLDILIRQKQLEVINLAVESMEAERREINEGREKIYYEFQDYKKRVGVLSETETKYDDYLNQQKAELELKNIEFRESMDRIRKTTRKTRSVSRRNAAREKVRQQNELKRKLDKESKKNKE